LSGIGNGESAELSPHLKNAHAKTAVTKGMRDLRQWLVWRSEERHGKPTKIPYSPLTGARASSTNSETWTGYQEAVRACRERGYDGLGFVFTPEDNLCGVDLDGCLDPQTGEIEGWAREIIEELDSYTEVSPSGTGVHVLVRAALPEGRNRKGRFEAYDRGRYFTVTGKHLDGTPQSIERRQEELQGVVHRVFGSNAKESANGHREPVAVSASGENGFPDDEVVRKALAASNGARFARLWSGDTDGYGSHSEADLALCGMLAFWSGGDPARMDSLFRQSGLYRRKWEREDYRNRTITEALKGKTEFYEPPKTVTLADGTRVEVDEPEPETKEEKPTQAQLLVRCAAGAELFHAPSGEAYASVPVGDHRETHQVKSKGFRRWLVRGYFDRHDRPPGAQALQDALGLLEARAQFDGFEREVHVRVAGTEGAVYVDLANERWEVAEIKPSGWRVVPGEWIPVRFRRSRGMLALPNPARTRGRDDGPGLNGLLRDFINVKNDDALKLVIAWLLQALRPTGPYPVLLFQGEQGSAKSTAERLVRSLVDPSTAPLRTTPRSERDLVIAATNSWCVAFDNISTLQPWLSDAMCRLSTGGGFSARELYTDSEEVLFDATRPLLLNGITDVATRPDFLDRALTVTLPPIPEEKRRPEAALWREFEKARPHILAALFDAVAGALSAVESVRLEGMPRMADFAVWVTAAEEALGWEPGAFMAAYNGNRAEATESALEADSVALAIAEFMEDKDEWTGTAGELWEALNGLVEESIRHTKAWPGAPNALSARLKRLAPVLRGIGIEYEDVRLPGSTRKRAKRLRKNGGAKDRPHRLDRPRREENPAKTDSSSGTMIAEMGRSRDDDALETVPIESPANGYIRDDGDGRDDDLRAHSVVASLENANPGIVEECAHGYPGGKGCFLCDASHPYRLEHGGAA
jgi:hypothetical protein